MYIYTYTYICIYVCICIYIIHHSILIYLHSVCPLKYEGPFSKKTFHEGAKFLGQICGGLFYMERPDHVRGGVFQ